MINFKKCLLAIMLTILASSIYAQDSESQPDNEIWFTGSDGKIVPPNKMDAFGAKLLSITYKDGKGVITFDGNVTSIGDWAFDGCGNLTSIEIPESVTSIGDWAFDGCGNLTSIEIPESVTSIGNRAFDGCGNLSSIEIPENVTSIGYDAFSLSGLISISVSSGNEVYDSRDNCNAIINSQTNELIVGCKNTVIPKSVTSIGENAFRNCNGLTSIEIPEGVTSIGDWAFCGTDLISIEIPESVMSVGKNAFYACYDLMSVTISEGVKSIGEAAFMVCHDLTSLALPQSITDIGENAFMGCSGLASISVSSGNKVYDSRDNCNAIINSQTNELIVGCKNTVIPNSITSIGNSAFNGCSGLTSIKIPEGVTSIGNSAFNGCSGLTSIKIPSSVTNIGDGAFAWCRGLTSIEIPEGVTSIVDWAFFGCSGLTFIEIPEGVTSIGSLAFYGCSSLKDVYCKCKNVPSIDTNTFYNFSTDDATLHVPSGTRSLYEAADGWKDFGTIVEMESDDTDISAFPNILYTEKQEVFTGHEAILSIKLKNEASITAFQFDLQLPDGITVAKDSNGKNQISLDASRKADDHTISTNVQKDGMMRIACFSMSNESFSRNDGTVVDITVNIPDDMVEGDYDLILKNIEMTTPDNQIFKMSGFKSSMTVSSYIPGDVNGDMEITITDAVGIVNFVIMANTEGLNEKAADANQDGSISITDAVYVVNMVIHAEGSNVKGELRENAPSSLALRPMNVVAGETFEMPVILNGTANSITAMQFDLTLPEGITLSGIKTDEEHTVAYQEQEDGTIRVASLSVDNSTYSGNGDKSVVLLLEAAPGFQEGVVSINNSELVTPGLRASHSESVSALICGNATGIDCIRSTEDTDIYDLQGRKTQRASHGIYIQNGKKTAVE